MFFIREEGTNCVLGGKRGRDKLLRRLRPLPPSKESNFVLNEEEKPVGGRNERMWVGSRMEGNPKIYFGIKKILIPFLLFSEENFVRSFDSLFLFVLADWQQNERGKRFTHSSIWRQIGEGKDDDDEVNDR